MPSFVQFFRNFHTTIRTILTCTRRFNRDNQQTSVFGFVCQVQYSEQTVNETLKRYHPDYATLRRELISHQLMQREDRVYWRVGQM
ncbi:DUF2087 domain-containing protein [Calothrix sp. PCC 7507]|uniref:DUF2087 domain-containing protein n=1 Tax=Calothrix sp. PCC 7507 TaxID=99598 RepID=UPI00191772C0